MAGLDSFLFFIAGFVIGMIVCCSVEILLMKQTESEVCEIWGKK